MCGISNKFMTSLNLNRKKTTAKQTSNKTWPIILTLALSAKLSCPATVFPKQASVYLRSSCSASAVNNLFSQQHNCKSERDSIYTYLCIHNDVGLCLDEDHCKFPPVNATLCPTLLRECQKQCAERGAFHISFFLRNLELKRTPTEIQKSEIISDVQNF